MPVDLDWGGIDDTKWCGIGIPDRVGQCSRVRGHIDPEHVAHWNSPGSSVHGQWFSRWHDGDTVSVKAGQAMKPAATAGGGGGGGGVAHLITKPLELTISVERPKVDAEEFAKMFGDRFREALAKMPKAPSRRELAESLLKTMVEWDMRSCTVKQQREFLDAIRMLKKEAKP